MIYHLSTQAEKPDMHALWPNDQSAQLVYETVGVHRFESFIYFSVIFLFIYYYYFFAHLP